jgi:hypothetical protein
LAFSVWRLGVIYACTYNNCIALLVFSDTGNRHE